MLLYALHQEYANRYIQYYGERYITSIYKNLHIEPFNTVSKSFGFGFGSGYHAQLSNENLPYIDLDSILLTVQMSLPINYLPYMKLVQLYREQH